ncbi:hypothetical protein [Leuconostoc suionicum]|uniref:hypothetical protein n=1 Tax=Leuconostoc suionicum TaxID=1511761 RepID=UPI0021A7731E|nr:hypothetical protein [Leuconostoc suionicum]MCT4401894.1 hypothetical protein [Leuconostoc suionicum]
MNWNFFISVFLSFSPGVFGFFIQYFWKKYKHRDNVIKAQKEYCTSLISMLLHKDEMTPSTVEYIIDSISRKYDLKDKEILTKRNVLCDALYSVNSNQYIPEELRKEVVSKIQKGIEKIDQNKKSDSDSKVQSIVEDTKSTKKSGATSVSKRNRLMLVIATLYVYIVILLLIFLRPNLFLFSNFLYNEKFELLLLIIFALFMFMVIFYVYITVIFKNKK